MQRRTLLLQKPRKKFTLEMHERMVRATLRPGGPGMGLPKPGPGLVDSLLKKVRPNIKRPVVK